jgi:hypothetical protein
MATFFVSLVMPTHMEMAHHPLTLICPLTMSHSKVVQSDFQSGIFRKRSANNTKSTGTETFYGSIISAMLEFYKVAK